MRIMEVVGSTDVNEVNLSSFVLSTQLLKMPVKAFVFGEKGTVWEVTIENTYRIMFVQGSYELIACIFDRFEVSWSNIAGGSRESEVFHEWCVAGERGNFKKFSWEYQYAEGVPVEGVD